MEENEKKEKTGDKRSKKSDAPGTGETREKAPAGKSEAGAIAPDDKKAKKEQALIRREEAERCRARELELRRKAEEEKNRARELELEAVVEEEKHRTREIELKLKEGAEKWRAKELEFRKNIEIETNKVAKLDLEIRREAEKHRTAELKLEKDIEAEKRRAKEFELEAAKQVEEHAERKLEIEKGMEGEKQKARELELEKAKEAEKHVSRRLELENGTEDAKRRNSELEMERAKEAEKHKIKSLEFQRELEAEKHKTRELELVISKETEGRRAKELELEKGLEEERHRVKGLELEIKRISEKNRAEELESQRQLEEEKRKAAESEREMLREAALGRDRARKLEKARESEKRRASRIELKKEREAERHLAAEKKLKKKKEKRPFEAGQKAVLLWETHIRPAARRMAVDLAYLCKALTAIVKVAVAAGFKAMSAAARRTAGAVRRTTAAARGLKEFKPGAISVAGIVIVLALVAVLFMREREPRPMEYAIKETLSRTFIQIESGPNGRRDTDIEGNMKEAVRFARKLDKKFDPDDPDSEVNRLNTEKMLVVSREFFDVVKKAKKMSRITGGVFDITSPGSGMDNLILRLDNSILLRNGISIDLSGIADGAIADNVWDFLKVRKMEDVIVNVGGDIYCGSRKNGGSWFVGLKETGSGEMSAVLALRDRAVATSGEYESVPVDGYPETAVARPDPSGEWVREDVSGVAVIAGSCAEAEALAKAMSGMEKDRAIELADGLEGVEVIIIECVEWETKLSFSKDAEKFIAKK